VVLGWVVALVALVGTACNLARQEAPGTSAADELRGAVSDPATEASDAAAPAVPAAGPTRWLERPDPVVACMRARGYSRYPRDGSIHAPYVALTDDAFRSRFGFGMLTLIEQQAQPALSPEELAVDVGPAALSSFYANRKACRAGQGEAPEPVAPDEAGEDLARLVRSIHEHDDYRAAREGWRTCMAEHGHSWQTREEMFEQLGRTANAFAGPFLEAVNRLRSEQRSDDAVRLEMADVLPRGDLVHYRRAYSVEVAAAQADHACGREVDRVYEALWREVVLGLEGSAVS
jgi:hypothetical protein